MRIHYFQHVAFEGPAGIAEWAAARGHPVTGTHFYNGEAPPHLDALDWLIIMGGPMNVYQEDQCPWLRGEKQYISEAISARKRVLGICLGAQLIAASLGERVNCDACTEIGWYPVSFSRAGLQLPALQGLPDQIEAFHWHSDTFEVPAGAILAASSAGCAHQLFIYGERVVAMQFHLETTPVSARQLIDHCGDPDRPEMQAMVTDAARFHAIRRALWRLLDNIQRL